MARAHLALVRTRRWQRVRRAAFDRDGWRCRQCGRPGRLEAHHEPPLERGGDPYDLDGIVTLCRGCHIARHRGEGRRESTDAERAWRRLVDDMRDAPC